MKVYVKDSVMWKDMPLAKGWHILPDAYREEIARARWARIEPEDEQTHEDHIIDTTLHSGGGQLHERSNAKNGVKGRGKHR